METTNHVLHQAKLNNNCPECYGTDGLELTFAQDLKENIFFKRPSKKMTEAMVCHNCNTVIYPERWNENLERVYNYNKKLAAENKLKMTVKPLFYVIAITDLILIGWLVYYFLG